MLHLARSATAPVIAAEDAVVVTSVSAHVLAGSKAVEEEIGGGGDCHSQKDDHWIVGSSIANPMSKYPEYKANRKSWGIDVLGTIVVKVELSNGIVGVGVSIGGPPACFLVEKHLARFVEGQDPRNVEMIWDQMYRSTVNYGRTGLPLHAISAVDLALWDCLGKLKGEPVYNLLGGMTKATLPVYATTANPLAAKKMGFHGAKVPLPYGPADGDEGLRKNIAYLQGVRKLVGEDFPVMVDCYMSLTPAYTIELCRKIEKEVPGGVKWVEEFLMPHDYAGYSKVKEAVTSTMLTTGEHEYVRYGYLQLLKGNCADVLQPDITWVGGVTEARRIVALASSFDIPVIPHGSSVYSYHLQMAFANCPLAELLILSPKGDKMQPLFGDLFTDEPLPVDGEVTLDPHKPGFGVTLNPAVKLERPFPHEPETRTQATARRVEAVPEPKSWLGNAAVWLGLMGGS